MALLAKLTSQLKKANHRNEKAPTNRILNFFNVHNSKDKYHLVEHKVPELVLDVFLLWQSETSKNTLLHGMAAQNKQAIEQIHQRLK